MRLSANMKISEADRKLIIKIFKELPPITMLIRAQNEAQEKILRDAKSHYQALQQLFTAYFSGDLKPELPGLTKKENDRFNLWRQYYIAWLHDCQANGYLCTGNGSP